MCGVYHPPQPTYRPSDFLQYLVHLVDNALDQHPGLTIVLDGDTNQLEVNYLCHFTGWKSRVDLCSAFYINKNRLHSSVIFTSRIKTQTCSPKNSHPGLQKTPKGGVILGTCGRDLGYCLDNKRYGRGCE